MILTGIRVLVTGHGGVEGPVDDRVNAIVEILSRVQKLLIFRRVKVLVGARLGVRTIGGIL